MFSWNQVSDFEYFVWKSRTITMTFMNILAPGPWNFDDGDHDFEEHGDNNDWQVLLLPFSDDNICALSRILLRLVAINVTTKRFFVFFIYFYFHLWTNLNLSCFSNQLCLPCLPGLITTSSIIPSKKIAARATLYLPWSECRALQTKTNQTFLAYLPDLPF